MKDLGPRRDGGLVLVEAGNLERALKLLKRKWQAAGLFHEMQKREYFLSRSVRRRAKRRRAQQRARKQARLASTP